MKLRKPCGHVERGFPEGHYDAHAFLRPRGHPESWNAYEWCPGGVFLPDALDLDALTEAFTASEGIFHQEDGWAELNDHGILIFDAAVEYLKLFRGEDALAVREAE